MLARILKRDCDIETARNNLLLRVISVSQGTTDSTTSLAFAENAPEGTISVLRYRIGEVRRADTLWGNVATAVITLTLATTGVESQGLIPAAFQLKQNFPNPFNPSTSIGYVLPEAARVSLTVYNTLGEQVAVLVQQEQEAGEYRVRFDGRGFSTGVYFYTLRAGESVQTRRLLLLK